MSAERDLLKIQQLIEDFSHYKSKARVVCVDEQNEMARKIEMGRRLIKSLIEQHLKGSKS